MRVRSSWPILRVMEAATKGPEDGVDGHAALGDGLGMDDKPQWGS